MAATEIDHASGIPLYRQIMNILRDEIEAGKIASDEPMTEAKLEARFGVSLAPIKQALRDLSAEGVVYRKQGRGTFPIRRGQIDRPANLKTGDLYRFLEARGLNPTSTVTGLERIEPPPHIMDRLRIEPGVRVLHFTREISVDDTPFAENDIYIAAPPTFFPSAEELRDGGSALTLLAERHGITVVSAEHEAWATAATAQHARALGVEKGDPLLVIDTLFFSRGQKPLAWRSAIHRPDEFKYHFVTNE